MVNFIKANKFCFIATLIFIMVGIIDTKLNLNLFGKLMEVFHFIFIDIVARIVHFICEMLVVIPYYVTMLCIDFPLLKPFIISIAFFISCAYCNKKIGNFITVMMVYAVIFTILLSISLIWDSVNTILLNKEISGIQWKENYPPVFIYGFLFYSILTLSLFLKFDINLPVETDKESSDNK